MITNLIKNITGSLQGKEAEIDSKNQVLIDHYTNVQNLCDQEKITTELAQISANAKELLGVPVPDQLFFYISGIDLEHPCLYFRGGKDSVIAFVGLDNFLGSAYPGYNAVPSYQRTLLTQSQLVVRYAQTVVENQVIKTSSENISFEINSHKKKILFEGLDDIAQTLEHEEKISEFEEKSTIPSVL